MTAAARWWPVWSDGSIRVATVHGKVTSVKAGGGRCIRAATVYGKVTSVKYLRVKGSGC